MIRRQHTGRRWKRDAAALPSIIKIYSDASESAARSGADLIIWPETVKFPFCSNLTTHIHLAVRKYEEYREQLLDLSTYDSQAAPVSALLLYIFSLGSLYQK